LADLRNCAACRRDGHGDSVAKRCVIHYGDELLRRQYNRNEWLGRDRRHRGCQCQSAGGSGATVALSGAATGTSSADANGNFGFAELTNGTYTVTPSKNGYVFTPPSQTVSVSGADVGTVDFTASAQSSSITMDTKVSVDGGSPSTTIGTSAFNTASANELLLAFIATDYYLSGAKTRR
jgi:hypothetical protein